MDPKSSMLTPCLVPEFWIQAALLSALNNFSQDKRARGWLAGQDSTVAAVSDRQEPPSMCELQAGVKYLSGL